MKKPVTMLTGMTLLLGIPLWAGVQMEIPKPAPELKKLDYFAGTWTTEGDIRPGPMGSGGRFTGANRPRRTIRWAPYIPETRRTDQIQIGSSAS